jgi:CheY-like chemotaxis protein
VFLPASVAGESASLREEERAPERRERRQVLVVDDHEDAADVLAAFFKSHGYETHTACDGESALREAQRLAPDAIVLDIGLPDIDGFEVARRLRADPRTRDAVLLALTGWSQESDKRRAVEAGFDHHMTKPASPPALERLLSEALEKKRGLPLTP